jgi:hypothetical protein
MPTCADLSPPRNPPQQFTTSHGQGHATAKDGSDRCAGGGGGGVLPGGPLRLAALALRPRRGGEVAVEGAAVQSAPGGAEQGHGRAWRAAAGARVARAGERAGAGRQHAPARRRLRPLPRGAWRARGPRVQMFELGEGTRHSSSSPPPSAVVAHMHAHFQFNLITPPHHTTPHHNHPITQPRRCACS